MDPDIHDDAAHHRYELTLGGATAYILYRRKEGVITFIHTEVPPALAGKSIGSRLARHVLETAQAEGVRVIPMCPFIAAWMKKHPEYDDLRGADQDSAMP